LSELFSETVLASKRMEHIAAISRGTWGQDTQCIEEVVIRVMIGDSNSVVRHEAAFALGRLYRNHLIEGRLAVEALSRSAMSDPSLLVRHEAAESLGSFVPLECAVATLLELSKDDNDDLSSTAKIGLERLNRQGGSL